MSAFYNALEAELDATTASDRQIICRPCIFADFASAPVRIWGGVGPLYTPDDYEWAGWMRINENDEAESFIALPKLTDVSDGSSRLYEFILGYIDADSYSRIRDLDEEVRDRLLVVSSVHLPDGSTRAVTPPGDSWRLRMKQSKFREKWVRDPDGGHRQMYSVSVLAKNVNEGRSRTEFGVMNDAGQQQRSEALFGISDDFYAQFVVKYINGYTINLDA